MYQKKPTTINATHTYTNNAPNPLLGQNNALTPPPMGQNKAPKPPPLGQFSVKMKLPSLVEATVVVEAAGVGEAGFFTCKGVPLLKELEGPSVVKERSIVVNCTRPVPDK